MYKVMHTKKTGKDEYDRDVEYWNKFYNEVKGLDEPSLFARSIIEELEKGKELLELGCGNGRDTRLFARKGLKITAVDASDEVINRLQTNYQEQTIQFVCGDFVELDAVYNRKYDYCYSRFSIHAISKEQECILLKNVYDSLRERGKLYIEVRSVNDELFGMGEKISENEYIYGGHYRRFIVKEELVSELLKVGYHIDFQSEERGYAPFGESDPPVIRVIASK